MTQQTIYEGTLQEIMTRYGNELANLRVKVVVETAENGTVTELAGSPQERVRQLLARWQAEDNTPILPPPPMHPGETPTQALFRKWEEEYAQLSAEEQEAEERVWESFQEGIDAERAKTGMRTLF